MPEPDLVRPPDPDATPENVVVELSPPAVSVLPPLVTVPAPAREPMVSSALSAKSPVPFSVTAAVVSPRDAPSTCRVAPSATVTAAEATEPVTETVPALTVVAPVYKLVPDNVIVPEPDLVRPPDPDATPENVVFVVSPAVSVRPPLVTVPAPAKEPMVSSAVVSVKLPEPFSVTAAVSTRDAPSTCRVASFATVTTVEATEPVTSSLPALTFVAPA